MRGDPIPDSHLEILEQAQFGYLSTMNRDGSIATNPVSIDWDGEHVRVSTLKARQKYRNLVADPRVTLLVVDPRNVTRYVELRGTAVVTDDPEGELVRAIYARGTGGRPFRGDEPGAERVVVTIHPDVVSAPALYGGRYDRAGQAAARRTTE